MRTAFVQALIKSTSQNPKIHLLTADLGFEVFEQFKSAYPDQFTNVGVAEPNMVGMASGMASTGMIPVCFTIIPFLTHRAFEQIRNDVSYPQRNVKLVGVGSGFTYGFNGQSHHALEDLALMRVLPNMTILCPSDPLETYQATIQMLKMDGPVYLRLGRRGEPILNYDQIANFKIGSAVVNQQGAGLAIFALGTMLETATEVVNQLQTAGLNPTLVHIHTLKPLDKKQLQQIISQHNQFVTIEEHSIIGGLGSALAELNCLKPQLIIGVEDRFYNVGGTQQYLKKLAELDSSSITKRIVKWLT